MKHYNNVMLVLKKPLLLIMLIFTAVASLFIGCGNNSINKDIKIHSIEITRQSDKKLWILSDKDIVTKFINALNNREETNSKLDIRSHDYFVKIYLTDKLVEEYMLWIDKDDNVYGILMKGNKAWYINKESNAVFKEILK